MKIIKAIFVIDMDTNLTGVSFESNGKKVFWIDLTIKEKIRMLKAWAKNYIMFYHFAKQEENNI